MAELFFSLCGRTRLRIAFVQYLIAFKADRKQLATSYQADLWGQIPDNRVKVVDPRINLSREISPEAA